MVNSIPKSGTNLLKRALDLLGFRDCNATASRSRWYQQFVDATGCGIPWSLHHGNLHRHVRARTYPGTTSSIPVGLRSTCPVPAVLIENWLNRLRPGEYMSGHVPFSSGFNDLLHSLDLRQVVIVRDPEAVLNSRMKYELNWSDIRYDHPAVRTLFSFLRRAADGLPHLDVSMERELRQRPPEERVRFLLFGGTSIEGNRVMGLHEQYKQILPWVEADHTQVVRFRNLVGPRGGGSGPEQVRTISTLCEFLDLPFSDHAMEHVASSTYDSASKTFRQGTTRSEHMTLPDRAEPDLRTCLDDIHKMLEEHGIEAS